MESVDKTVKEETTMKRPEDYTTEEQRIMAVCEACRLAIAQEEFLRYENEEPELTELQRLIIYQRYQDLVVLKYPSARWEEVSQLFDRLFKDIEEYHADDSLVYA